MKNSTNTKNYDSYSNQNNDFNFSHYLKHLKIGMLSILFGIIFLFSNAGAVSRIDITRGNIDPTPIAYNQFTSKDNNTNSLAREIKELVESKKIEGITNLKNLTNKRGMDIRVWVGKYANTNVVLNLILKHTSLRTNFSVNSTVLMENKKVVENVPMIKLVEVFVNHRKEVLTRKFNAELVKNNRRTHILEGLIGITSKIDAVIKLIREADNREIALQGLISGGKGAKNLTYTTDSAAAVAFETSEQRN
jgi:DNA gyrase/topoisomerase IV subunit A